MGKGSVYPEHDVFGFIGYGDGVLMEYSGNRGMRDEGTVQGR